MSFTILGIVLAVLGFGLVLLVGTLASGKTPVGAVGGGATTAVVVAATDVAIRTPLQATDLKVARFSSGDVPPGGFARVDDLKNLVAAVDIKKGQALTSNMLVKSGLSLIHI